MGREIFPFFMLKILEKFDYSPPNIELYDDGNIEVCPASPTAYQLKVNGERWMVYDFFNHSQACQVFSHYDLADGHCICTGLGFGVRESWLLTKKNVSKITILEKNKEVIEYHQYLKSPFLDHVEIVNCDATEYKGKCDTLLLDHYEFEPTLNNKELLYNDIRRCVGNIDHDLLWFWPIEHLLLVNQKFNKNKYESYEILKKKFSSLPDLSPEDINFYVGIYHLR